MTPNHYTPSAIRLHWLLAALIFVIFPLGIVVHGMAFSPLKLQLLSYHKWLGVTIFVLALVRLAWRATHTPPPLPDSLPRWQHRVSHLVHGLLYVLMLTIPVSGWLMSSAKGFQTVLFGVLPLPDLIDKNKTLAETLFALHQALNFSLLGLLAAHIGAALKHHLIDHDDILTRMLPFLSKDKP
jgi:cytochrome b561